MYEVFYYIILNQWLPNWAEADYKERLIEMKRHNYETVNRDGQVMRNYTFKAYQKPQCSITTNEVSSLGSCYSKNINEKYICGHYCTNSLPLI